MKGMTACLWRTLDNNIINLLQWHQWLLHWAAHCLSCTECWGAMQLLALNQNKEQDTIRVMDMQGLVRDMFLCVCFLLFDFWEKVSWVDGKNSICSTLVPCQQPTNITLGGFAMLCKKGKAELWRNSWCVCLCHWTVSCSSHSLMHAVKAEDCVSECLCDNKRNDCLSLNNLRLQHN